MNYYPHNIGDFNNATRHLTRLERSVYRDMIDLYYGTEKPLPLDFKALCRLLIARANDEATAVQQVLNEFFTETPQGWYHDRCEMEIEKYRANNTQKAIAGKASAAAKAAKKQQAIDGNATPVNQSSDIRSTDVEQTNNGVSTNQEPITNNQEPLTNKKTTTPPADGSAAPKFSALQALKAAGVDEQVAKDWLAVRRTKKLAPTQTAISSILAAIASAGMQPNEAIKACVVRGWGGFNASWLENAQAAPLRLPQGLPHIGMSDAERTKLNHANTDAAYRMLFGDSATNDDERTVDA